MAMFCFAIDVVAMETSIPQPAVMLLPTAGWFSFIFVAFSDSSSINSEIPLPESHCYFCLTMATFVSV